MIVAHAHAKINLALHVTGRRGDGYHDLDSLVAFADLHDALTLSRHDRYCLTVHGPHARALLSPHATSGQNMIDKAVALLSRDVDMRVQKVAINLQKNLPVAAGLGGGSADAAAALTGIVALFNINITPSRLQRLAAKLGSDVPVCVHGRACRMRGRGDVIALVPSLPDLALLLVNPAVAVTTPQVFSGLTTATNRPLPEFPKAFSTTGFITWLQGCRNDLLPPALTLAPVIGETIAAIKILPGCLYTSMSGSGATCFGLFETREQAKTARRHIKRDHPHWWSQTAKLLGASH